MDVEKKTETTLVLDDDYSVDVYVDGEHDWDIASNEAETRIEITEWENDDG